MNKRFIFVIIIFFCVISYTHAQEYILGGGDVLMITIHGHDDLKTTARVSGEGNILMPLLGEIKVEGLTVSQVSQKISRLLADGYIIDPHTNVFIKEFRSKKVMVLGEVYKPGLYELSGNSTFLELISKAGGLRREAGHRLVIKRKNKLNEKNKTTLIIDMESLVEKGDASQNIMIMNGDSIYVPKADMIYITGEVKKPDAYKYEKDITIIKAITLAGGFTKIAKKGGVRIIRKVDGEEKIIKRVKMDKPVLPDDVIVVPESFF